MRIGYRNIVIAVVAAVVLLGLFFSGGDRKNRQDGYEIGVFVPGVVDGSPTYEMLVAGVERAVGESPDSAFTVIEGGFDQSGWEQGVMSMASSGSYDLIVTSNPSMPEICDRVTESYPDQYFLILDGYLPGNDHLYTVLFNQREQAFLAGYFAGLATSSEMELSNPELRVGLLAGQEYPIMNEVILPGYELGVRTVQPEATVDFRVLGNWYDAGKAGEIVADMIGSGSDIILTIAGGGNQGAIAAARERGAYVLWYDDSGYDQAPGVVAGSTFVRQDVATYETTKQAIAGTLRYGEPLILGVAQNAVDFDTTHPAYIRSVPESIRTEMDQTIERLRSGALQLEMPVR